MRDFLVVIIVLYLLGASVAMSTGTFVRRFPKWTDADQVEFVCNGTEKIAQYCDTGHQSCRNKTSPGVSLDKHGLTITNCTYNSWSCEAHSYIHGIRHTENFTVDLSNQHASTSPSLGTHITSPSPGAPITSPSPGAPITSPSPGITITSPSPGNNESHSGAIAAGVIVTIFCLVVLMIFLYLKVKCFKQAVRDFLSILQRKNRNPDKEKDIEAGDSEAGDGEAGDGEAGDIEAGDGEAGKFLTPGSMV